MEIVRLATRGSPLALAQANMAAAFLGAKLPGVIFEIVEIKTTGDKRLDWSLEKFGGKGLFTKEIEEALISGEADIAVHSAKDLPTQSPDGLSIAGCLPRDACADILVVRDNIAVPSFIATGSPRRREQLKKIFPQAVWGELRGNVHTRLKKLVSGEADATVLSAAGLSRLGIEKYDGVKFTELKLDVCVPAVAQGIIALQCRCSEAGAYSALTDSKTNEVFAVEREFLTALGGGCQSAYAANYDGETFRFFHELTGIQRVKLEGDLQSKLSVVRELASGIS